MAKIGTLIEDKYEILKMIGKGGMSEVYLAMDRNLNKQWAVKEIKKKTRDKNNAVIIQSAIAEANLMKRLDHPCLPRIVDIINREEVIYVIMDYIEGEPLNKVLEKYGAQPQETVIEWAKDLCGVLDYLHNQNPPIIYRDMKPANIMLQPNGNIKLIDFGIAREYKEQNLQDTVSLGTKGYAAPEQFGGKGQTDCRTDIYCLGVTIYHMVTGKNPSEPPYEIYPIRYWNSQLSAGLEKIILKCTQMNPKERYSSCVELLYALSHYEEADDHYRKKQKKKVWKFFGSLLLSLFFMAVGIGGQYLKSSTINNNYESYILQAQKASDYEEKIQYYIKAITMKPEDVEAYRGLVKVYKEDAVFSLEEEAQFKQQINVNLSKLREHKDYAVFSYEVGILYWYYYDYGKSENTNNQVTRMKSSIQWFDDACQYGNEADDHYVTAKVYKEIGQFNRDIILNVEEAADKGTYSPYFENLNSLVTIVSEEENEIVNLEVYKLCMYSIENYARKFMLDGVDKAEIDEFYQTVCTCTEEMTTTTDKTQSMKAEIMNRTEAAKTALEHAYSDTEE